MFIEMLLSGPEKWTREMEALDVQGRSVPFYSPDAVSWSLIGALKKAYLEPDARTAASIRLYTALSNSGWYSLVDFNKHSGTTYQKVLDLVREAGV